MQMINDEIIRYVTMKYCFLRLIFLRKVSKKLATKIKISGINGINDFALIYNVPFSM